MATQYSADNARLCVPHLIDCARRRETIPYSELAEKIGRHHRAMAPALEHLLRECHRLELPTIGTLVVNKQSRLPGDGFIVDQQARQLVYGSNQYKEAAVEEQERVYSHQNWQPLREAYGLQND